MLAPRKTLWSTPLSAVDHLVKWIPLQPNDCVCDIGCGDGRILLQWAQLHCQQQQESESEDTTTTSVVKFLGIDIDPERIQQCQKSLEQARLEGTLNPRQISIEFVCANALESPALFQDANIFFLYLIPRGLKLIRPLLLEHKHKQELRNQAQLQQQLQVVTYMAKLPGETHVDRALLSVDHQPEAAWPLYFYKL
jgi:SAM-dependent methyltransferase